METDRLRRLVDDYALELRVQGEELREERTETAVLARRIADSTAWRLGHFLVRLLRLGIPGRSTRSGAPESIAEQSERKLELSGDIQRSSMADGRHAASSVAPRRASLEVTEGHLQRLAERPGVAIVIPVYDAGAELERCLASVFAYTDPSIRVIAVDDASREPQTRQLLARWEAAKKLEVIRNEANRGFAYAANQGIDAVSEDVLLLNSDTAVTPSWLSNLAFAAYSGERVATATPFSNDAGIHSAPQSGVPNPDRNLTHEEIGRRVTQASERLYPTVPTGGGFCLYLKRAALDQVSGFDHSTFPRGYGEEYEFCMRATEKFGWQHVIDDATWVFHQGQASFRSEKPALVARAQKELNRKHPDYANRLRAFQALPEAERARRNVRRALLETRESSGLPRVLIATSEIPSDLELAEAGGWDGRTCTRLTLAESELGLTLYAAEATPMPAEMESWPDERTPLPGATALEGWTQFELLMAGIISAYAVERILLGKSTGTTDALERVSNVLGVPCSTLLGPQS